MLIFDFLQKRLKLALKVNWDNLEGAKKQRFINKKTV